MSKRTIIKGTLILTITGILTKCLGFYNRIFLTRLIGVKELGTYQLIFPLYILGISFCCQGIATTITKHVSYLLGKKKYSDTRRALCFGGFLSFVLSLLVSACFFFGCDCGGFFLFRCGFPQFGQKETALPGREAPQ